MWVRLSLPLVLAIPASLPAQAPPNQTPPPDDTLYALTVDPANYPGQDYVVLLDDGLVVIESDGRSSFSTRQVAQVLTRDGAEIWGEFAFSYVPERQNLHINWMRVVAEGAVLQDGPEHQTESDAGARLNRPVYSDRKIVQATLASVAPGVIVDYSYTIDTYQPRLPGDVLYDWSVNLYVPVIRSRFVLDTPAELTLNVIERNMGVSAETASSGGRTTQTWQLEGLAAIELERFAGWPNEVFKSIRVGGTVSWEDIGAWYSELLRGRFELTGEISEAFAAVAENATTLEDSLKTAYRWVKQDFRYVSLALGDGGYQPRPPVEVYRTRFGDCKDKTSLFIALARAMGLDAYPVLVSNGGTVDSLLPSVKQFDHMIAGLEWNGRVEFLDLTAWLAPYGELPAELQGTVGLAIDDDGDARIVVLPASDPASNRLDEEIVGTVRQDGTFVGSITVSATGTEQYDLRADFLDFGEYSETDRQEILQEWGATWESAIIDSSRVFEGGDLETDARVTVWFTNSNVAVAAGDRYLMNLPLRDFGNPQLVSSLESAGERHFPIDIAMVNSPSVYRSTLDVEFPEGWTVQLPENARVEGPFGYYHAEYRQVGAHFHASREMGGLRGLLPPDSAEALIAFVRGVSDDGTDYILIDPGSGARASLVSVRADTSSELARVLPVAEDLGSGARLVVEGPSGDESIFAMSDARIVRSWERQFAAEEMVFSIGSSRLVMLSVAAAEYGSSAEASRTQKFLDIIDLPAAFQALSEHELPGQTTIGETRAIDLAELGESARGWAVELVTPLSTFDISILLLSRGRVSVSLFAMGVHGMRDEDLGRLAKIADTRILQNGGYLVELDRDLGAGATETDETEPSVAERADGVALDEMLLGPEDLPGSVLMREEFAHVDGAPVYEREFEGRGFTFPVAGTEVLSLSLDMTLQATEEEAASKVLRMEDDDPIGPLSEALESSGLVPRSFLSSESSVRPLDVPAVGSRSAGRFAEIRGAVRADVARMVFSAGRLVADVTLATVPGELDPQVLYVLADEIHERMLRVAPEVASGKPSDEVIAAIERAVAIEHDVDSLVDDRRFEAVFEAIERADSAGGPVSFEPNTWNKVCWYASLYGFAERAMPACEATVAADTTRIGRRDSRGLARALVGDFQGAIDDFRYVVEHASDGEFLEKRSAWLDALLAGENPFTDDVLRALREQ